MSDDPNSQPLTQPRLDAKVFQPKLFENFVETDYYLHIDNPLTAADFPSSATTEGSDDESSFVTDLKDVIDEIKPGFLPGNTLNRNQWSRACAQLLAAMHRGLRKSHNKPGAPAYFTDMDPDEENAFLVLGKAAAAFARFFSDPTTKNPSEWQQCARCLEFSHTTITQDHWEAQLMSCGQHVNEAKLNLINAQIRLFQNELADWENKVCDHVYDQIILNVTTRSPPNLIRELAEPRLAEYIHQRSTALRLITENGAEERAINDAEEYYRKCVEGLETLKEEDLNTIRANFDAQIDEVRKNAQAQLDHEKDKAYQELANFKAQLKVEREARKADLAQDRILNDPGLAHRTGRTITKARKLKTYGKRRDSSTGSVVSIASQEMTTGVADMDVEPNDGNSSSTPTADPIPLPERQTTPSVWSVSQPTGATVAVPKATTLGTGLDQASPQYAEKAQPITPLAGASTPSASDDLFAKLAALIQPIQADLRDMKSRVEKIETGGLPAMDYNMEYNTWGDDIGCAALDFGDEEPLTAEQQAYYERAKALAALDDPQNVAAWQQMQDMEEEERLNEEDCEVDAYFARKKAEPAAATGTESQPIPVPSQSTTTRTPIPGLVSIPTGMFQKFDKQGNLSYAAASKQVPTTGLPPPAKPSQPHPLSFKTRTKRMTTEQMQGAKCTRAMIAEHALRAFGVKLSPKMRKAQLIAAYNQAADKTSNSDCPCPPVSKSQSARSQPQTPKAATTSTWIIRRKAGHAGIAFTKPFGGNSSALFEQIKTDIRQHAGAEPPITLLGGRWSTSPLSTNYVLTFAGKPSPTIMQKYMVPILSLFPDIYHLVPTEGYTRLLIHGAPCVRRNGILAPLAILQGEIGKNPAFHGASLIEGPLWSRGAIENPERETDTMSVVIYDDTGNKVKQIIKSRNFLFGKQVSIRIPRETKPVKQCERCHFLTHPTEKCNKPPNYRKCAKCGLFDHKTADHSGFNCRGKHGILRCSCPPKCFNCLMARKPAAGHWADSDACPLKQLRPATTLIPTPNPTPDPNTTSTPAPPPTLEARIDNVQDDTLEYV